jgi:hypothetical protein
MNSEKEAKMKRKWPTDLKTVRRKIAKTRADLAYVAELMETVASLDLRDQRPLFFRQADLEWELRQLREVEARLVERAWQTVEDPAPHRIVKVA